MPDVVDVEFLAQWLQPKHLDPGGLRERNERFRAHPARLLHLEDVLLSDVAERLGIYLSSEATFRPNHGLYSTEGSVSAETWEAAQPEDRFFRVWRVADVPPKDPFSPNLLTYLQFRAALKHEAFRAWFEALTGSGLGPSDDFGVQAMGRGDFLKDHDDDNKGRRVAFVLYLTPGWEPAFGGALRMVDTTGGETRIHTAFNSMVVFDVGAGSTHSVDVIEDTAGDLRRATIGGWFPDAPE